MTAATHITISRILLVPVFAVLAVYYARSFESPPPDERYRWWAVAVFVLASATDGIDGYVARRFNQRSRLGAVLDPLADKLLVLTALITLSVVQWGEGWSIPIWFSGLVIARDVVILGGIAVLHFFHLQVHVDPHWTGKVSTALLMVTLAWVMLQIIPFSPIYPVTVTALFLVLSGANYFRQGLAQLKEHGHAEPHA